MAHRADWKENHQTIIRAYAEFIRKNQTMPTKKQISKITNLNRNTVADHIKEIQDQNLAKKVIEFKPITESILTQLAKDILSQDNPSASKYKLFLQVIEQWSEKTEVGVNFDKVVEGININIHKPNKDKED